MDLKNEFLKLSGMNYDVRPSSQMQAKTEQNNVSKEQTLEMLADAFQIAIEKSIQLDEGGAHGNWYLYLDNYEISQSMNPDKERGAVGPLPTAKKAEDVRSLLSSVYSGAETYLDKNRNKWRTFTPRTESVDSDVSLTYRVSGASQASHGYWSQVSRVAGFGLKNKTTGDMLDVPYGMAFESRKEAKDYLKQAVSKDERSDWSVIDWAMECVAFGTSVEGYVLKHKEDGSTHGPRFMTPKGAEDFMNQKMSPEERRNYKVDPIELTKESVGLGMQGYVIQNTKTNAIKSGPYDTKEEAEEYLRRHTDGVTDPAFSIKKYEDVLGMSNYPNGKGVTESVDLEEGKTRKDRPSKAAGAKTLNTVLMTKKGGGHRTDKDYNRQKAKAEARKALAEAASMDKDAFANAHKELKTKGYEKTHSAMADDKDAGGVFYSHPESKKKAVIRKGKIHYDVNENIVIETEKFLLQKEKVGNFSTKSSGSKGQNSSNVGAPAYDKPQYKRPDYDHTEISDEHTLFGKEEEAGGDVPQQYGSIEVPAEVLKAVRDSIKHCRDVAAKTEEDVINTRGHSDKSWWKNTADMLQEVLDWLESGDEANLKRAVVKMQSWENARWWSWPSELIKYMAHYGYGYKYPKLADRFKEVKANLIPLK